MKTRSPGFTLIELMVVVAIVAIVAAAAIPAMRSASRNASVSSAGFGLQMRLQGLKARAMANQETLVAVLVDAPGNDGTGCVLGRGSECTTLFVLRSPAPAWTLNAFDPANPAVNAEFADSETLGKGIRFANDPALDKSCYVPNVTGAPRPFEKVKLFATEHTGTCGGRRCVGVRFSPDGTVSGELASAPAGVPKGIAFSVGSDLVRTTVASECRAVLVSFPNGIVKSFAPRSAP